MTADIERHNRLYARANRLIEGRIDIDGAPPPPAPDWLDRRRLRRAGRLFREVLKIQPGNLSAMIFIGKIHQRLTEPDAAMHWFTRALEIEPGQPAAAREAAITASDLGRYDQSIQLTQMAIAGRPDDGGLYSNLALACLLAGRPRDAVEALKRAAVLEPDHPLTPRLLKFAEQVAAERRPCPKNELEIRRAV